jgi:hypothetical protein
MARSPQTCQALGRSVARTHRGVSLSTLLRELIWILRDPPTQGRLTNAVEHMWGHVRDFATPEEVAVARANAGLLLARTQALAVRLRDKFLLSSTALSELAVFLDPA